MVLDAGAAYLAVRSRDARFDGRLYVGVTSTGVYCRPICRVRTPRRENCRFFRSAAEAEAERFRPCLKCRPEVAPGAPLAWSVMDASKTLALQAAALLDAIAHENDAAAPLAGIAARLGVSERHVRRIFVAEHGIAPLQYLQTRRLLLAKQLLTDSTLPVTQVAAASGFRSLRRFNAAFAERYRLAPSRLRREAKRAGDAEPHDSVALTLAFRPPLDVQGLLAFFAQRAIPGVEVVDPSSLAIRRSVRAGVLGPRACWIEARFVPERCQVRLCLAASLASRPGQALHAVRRWFDLDAAPDAIDTALHPLLPSTSAGTRIPGALDGFELAARAVLGQRVTVAGARTLAQRLVERFGAVTRAPWPDVARAFPAPERLVSARAQSIGELGILRVQVDALQALALAWPELDAIAGAPRGVEERARALIDALCRLRGVGAWTAHYIAMRWLGWNDAFPPGDVAVLKALGLEQGNAGVRGAEALSQAWRPWRAYAVLRLWNGAIPS